MDNKIYYINYVVGDYAEIMEMCLRNFEREYQDYNVKFIPAKIDETVWGIKIVGTFNEVLKFSLDFKPLGDYMIVPYTDYIKEVE